MTTSGLNSAELDLGNNETAASGVFETPDGSLALTDSQSKTFQTRKGAHRWWLRHSRPRASTWSPVPQALELKAITAFRKGEAEDAAGLEPSPRTVVVCAASERLEEAVNEALDRAADGIPVLLRTPATPHAPFARRLFEHHDAIAFWLHGETPIGTMYTYLGPEVWRFGKVFRRHAAVFLRGRGATGPWSSL